MAQRQGVAEFVKETGCVRCTDAQQGIFIVFFIVNFNFNRVEGHAPGWRFKELGANAFDQVALGFTPSSGFNFGDQFFQIISVVFPKRGIYGFTFYRTDNKGIYNLLQPLITAAGAIGFVGEDLAFKNIQIVEVHQTADNGEHA